MGTIIGNQNPRVGDNSTYEITMFGSIPLFNPNNNYEWYLFKRQKSGNWIDITKEGIPKKGSKVEYKFFEPVAGDLFEIRVFEVIQGFLPSIEASKKLFGKLEITPTASKTSQIDKVVLFNRGKNDVNKADYRDTLVAQAFCTGLFGKEIEFQLWEDDAAGEGHNATINKNNRIPRVYKATVNEKGIAEAKISLSTDEKIMRQIANKFLMRGDKDEGANHEYYVTAHYLGKGEKASQVNVNVKNPDYRPKPKADSAKFPATANSKTPKQPDAKSKILDAYFVNLKGEKLSKIALNDSVKVRISSQNMKGKKVQYVIWEYDSTGHDEILRRDIVLMDDLGDTSPIKIDAKIFGKGYATDRAIFGTPIDGDSVKQNYFIEVIPLDISAESKKFGVDSDGLMDVEKMKSPAIVNAPKKDKPGSCFCKEHLQDLIWGAKVSCEFRKKVIEIAKRLGKDPNLLMAGMALETGRSFSPTAGKGSSYVGLIQFGEPAAKSVGTTTDALLKMTAMEQLDYVEKYLTKKKDKINTLTDFYLSILMPVDVGKGNEPNHIVFDNTYPLTRNKNGQLTDLSKSRHYGYRQNPAFYYEGEIHKNIRIKRNNGKTESFKALYDEKKIWYENGEKKYDGEGKTYIWEIEKSISKFYEEGKLHKVKTFECGKDKPASGSPTLDKGTWNVIITENYTGKKCTHIEKTAIRDNCRKGKIEVYDHNQKIILTFSDCLLEGIAGEDHMKTNSDVPFGDFQINQTTPFYHSTEDNKKSYGPNPRLVFEPISGNDDEAAKSGRSAIRIHGGRQVGYTTKTLKRTQGCIRVWDDDAKALYDWWVEYSKSNPNVKPGKVTIKK